MEALLEAVIRLVLAAGLSSFIGLEREASHKPAGLRTHVLVALGAALATVMAVSYTPADSARVIAGIITGIGFLGAGSIIASRGAVQGLTTAATIWLSAILGIAAGAGFYEISLAATLITIIVLRIKSIERKL